MKIATRSMRALIGVAAAVAIVGTATLARAQEPTFKFEVKGQIFSETTDFGTGQDRQGSRTDIHFQRLRLAVTGMFNDVWGFKFQTCGNCGTSKNGALGYAMTLQDVDWNDRDIRIIDGYAIANFSEKANLKIGLTKIPLTRANLDDCFAPLSQDRSYFVYSAYGTSPAKFSRDMGLVAWGGFSDDKLRYYAAAFQGREGMTATVHPFSGATVKSSIEPKSSLEYVGRLHYAFLDAEPGAGYQGSYLGELKVFTVGGGVAYEPSAVYRNVTSAGVVLDEATADYTAYSADMMFEYPTKGGTPTATAQYLKLDFDDAYKTNLNPGDRLVNISGMNGQKNGYYVKGAYLFPGKIGKEGMMQPFVLYEDWKFAYLLGITDQRIKQSGLGLNYYIHKQNVRLTLEYLKTTFDKATGFVGGRVDPITFAPIDKLTSYNTFRIMMQVGAF
ncbi:MAG: selenite/tellurite reduction operon porin ExtI [Acidobacteria bacterium]|nr:selenite/tellurite reduction operon porin ExtI [Acidobacteriota bacterium]